MPSTDTDEQFRSAPHKRRPRQIVEAQFGLPYLIAVALVHGRVGITEVADIHNSRVLDLAARMTGAALARENSAVIVQLHDGRKAGATADLPLGSPEKQLSAQQLAAKFTDCAHNAVPPLPDDAVHAAINMIRHLGAVPNVNELLRHFV